MNDLIALEVQRHTDIGNQIQDLLSDNKNVWTEPSLIVAILKKIIFSKQILLDSGSEEPRVGRSNDRYLLIGFPDQIDHVELFEADCAHIRAIIYTSPSGRPTVEIKGDDLSLKNIDTLFAKEYRLKTMSQWDTWTFEERLGRKVSWGLLIGRKCSGRSTLAGDLKGIINGRVLNM